MATVTITHATLTNAAADTTALVDGPKWDAAHTVTGLENVDNTSDANKPVSTAQAAALALKANLSGSNTFTGTITGAFSGSSNTGAFLASAAVPNYCWQATGQAADQKIWDAVVTGTTLVFRAVNDASSAAATWMTVTRGAGATVSSVSIPNLAIVKGDVGLGNVDNTSDATKNAAVATLTNKTFDTAGAGNSLLVGGVNIATAWTAYTPTVTAGSGTPTTVSATGRYKQIGKTVHVQAKATLTAIGTAAGNVVISLPFAASAFDFSGIVFESGVTGKSGACVVLASTSSMLTKDAAAVSWWVNGYILGCTMTYEVP